MTAASMLVATLVLSVLPSTAVLPSASAAHGERHDAGGGCGIGGCGGILDFGGQN